jgi:hypothetical protein
MSNIVIIDPLLRSAAAAIAAVLLAACIHLLLISFILAFAFVIDVIVDRG